jgi:hypothetical protein
VTTFPGGKGARYFDRQVRQPSRAAWTLWRGFGKPPLRVVKARIEAMYQRAAKRAATESVP